MAIELWDPRFEMGCLCHAIDVLVQENSAWPGAPPALENESLSPLDVAETERAFVVKAPLAGARPENVHFAIQGDTLLIRGALRAEDEPDRRPVGRRLTVFQHRVSLGQVIDAQQVQIHHENGMVTLSLPKTERTRAQVLTLAETSSKTSSRTASA